jgi:DNA-directed RNA polymerase specialized sigma24 family protein
LGITAAAQNQGKDIELQVLVDEFLSRCDPVTRDIFHRRLQGFSWKEIAHALGTSAHAAESRFGQSLQRMRMKLGLDRVRRTRSKPSESRRETAA